MNADVLKPRLYERWRLETLTLWKMTSWNLDPLNIYSMNIDSMKFDFEHLWTPTSWLLVTDAMMLFFEPLGEAYTYGIQEKVPQSYTQC